MPHLLVLLLGHRVIVYERDRLDVLAVLVYTRNESGQSVTIMRSGVTHPSITCPPCAFTVQRPPITSRGERIFTPDSQSLTSKGVCLMMVFNPFSKAEATYTHDTMLPAQSPADVAPPVGVTPPQVLAQEAAAGRRGAAW